MRRLKVRQFSSKADPDEPNYFSHTDKNVKSTLDSRAIEPAKQTRPCAGSGACFTCEWRMSGASMRHF
jgi:hypothetical protein